MLLAFDKAVQKTVRVHRYYCQSGPLRKELETNSKSSIID